jgi:hypothetical protein
VAVTGNDGVLVLVPVAVTVREREMVTAGVCVFVKAVPVGVTDGEMVGHTAPAGHAYTHV